MDILVVSDAHIWKTVDGKYWCNTAMHGYSFWERYLGEFDRVIVVARIMNTSTNYVKKSNYVRADGTGVIFSALPFIRGIKGYALHFGKMIRATKRAAHQDGCALFRLPSIPGFLMLQQYIKTHKPYAVEVVIDPENEYSEVPFLKWLFCKMLKKACKEANGASYVTKDYLQKKYPSKARIQGKNTNKYFESYYSSIDLKKEFFYYDRKYKEKYDTLNILHIANSINNENKGHRVLIDICQKLKEKGINVNVTFVGYGDKVGEFKAYGRSLGLSDCLHFVGYLSSKEIIREYLINSDIFVFPTKAEGLPRVLLEAMATGLPCLSTNVDGIPEILDSKDIFAPLDADSFVNRILYLINNPYELEMMGKRNIEVAEKYEYTQLKARRDIFYKHLRNLCGHDK
ncbi:MAG: glycosyltransferase family 4 protein [Ruminococcus sp.]|jgi:glycosyltransferase involved in cell wall biosynthesis|nr:glycosyltransferase family 4 protein [Ruminococcus sp.]